jgi:ABC-type phosphate transport system substrate-binding protein
MTRHVVIRIAGLSVGALLAASAHGQTTERIVLDGSTGVLPLAVSLARA